MKHINKRLARVLGLFLMSATLLCAWQAEAQTICNVSNTICISASSINMFRDSTGDNEADQLIQLQGEYS